MNKLLRTTARYRSGGTRGRADGAADSAADKRARLGQPPFAPSACATDRIRRLGAPCGRVRGRS